MEIFLGFLDLLTCNVFEWFEWQTFFSGGDEELLEDPVPLRNVRRPDGRRAQIFLRYKDDPEKAVVKLYGGWLRQAFFFPHFFESNKSFQS